MNPKSQNGMQCSQFEALLAEELDGTLGGVLKAAFDVHGQSCEVCGPMLAEAREGMLLLAALPEIEPPRNLVHNILAATSLAEATSEAKTGAAAAKAAKQSWMDRLRIPGMLHSRFVTSFCMAFFSLSLTLTLAGVRVSDLARMAMHPMELRKNVVLQYTQLEAKVERYYDNMRLVVEVESRVRNLKKAASPAPESENERDNNKQKQNRNEAPDTSHGPEERQNYSRQRDESVIARSMIRSEGAEI